jgi:hypothetical protein
MIKSAADRQQLASTPKKTRKRDWNKDGTRMAGVQI